MFLFRQAPILRPRELAELTEIFQIDDETDGLDNLYKLSVSVEEVLNITVHIATYLLVLTKCLRKYLVAIQRAQH